MTQTSVQLNDQQVIAIQQLVSFIQDPNPPAPFFVLAGYAGTGKTFCMREVVAQAQRGHTVFKFTAPTNKAAKVLREIVGEASTIYALLGLTVTTKGELKEVTAGKKVNLSDIDVVVVDEGSMVNRILLQYILAAAEKFGTKFIFLGDPAQLPPVGEPESPIWGLGTNAALTKVMRHENQVLDLVTSIRDVVNHPAPCINIKSDHDEVGGVWKFAKATFRESIYKAAINGQFADGAVSKVIAWRNVRVGEYNALIRNAIYGAEAQQQLYLPGERVVAGGPCARGDEPLMNTDEEAIVEGVVDCQHPMEPKYKAIELKATTEGGKLVRLLCLHPASMAQYQHDCELLAADARAKPQLWPKFWRLKELFHDIRYAYAITAHRSQGSTYEDTWVDYGDILLNRNRREAFQCLYVACSRPTTRLYLSA